MSMDHVHYCSFNWFKWLQLCNWYHYHSLYLKASCSQNYSRNDRCWHLSHHKTLLTLFPCHNLGPHIISNLKTKHIIQSKIKLKHHYFTNYLHN
jgi:hypothetical protein